MGLLEFLTKIIGLPWKIGGGVALGALAVHVLNARGLEPFKSIDPSLYRDILVAGVIGAAVALFEIATWIPVAGLIGRAANHRRNTQGRKMQAIRIMEDLTLLRPDFGEVLWYLRSSNMKKFDVHPANMTLATMEKECLLDIYTPGWGVEMHAYYRVPDYVWNRIDDKLRAKFAAQAGAVPQSLGPARLWRM